MLFVKKHFNQMSGNYEVCFDHFFFVSAGDETLSQNVSFPRKRSLSLSDESDNEDSRDSSSSKHRKRSPSLARPRVSSFLDLSYWKK